MSTSWAKMIQRFLMSGIYHYDVVIIFTTKHAFTSKPFNWRCGPGFWSFDIATSYPNSKVTGLDISPIQPSGIKPENFTFIQANLFDGLPFKDNTFDFVFQRFMAGCIAKEQWPSVMNDLIRVLKPGGYLEVKNLGIF